MNEISVWHIIYASVISVITDHLFTCLLGSVPLSIFTRPPAPTPATPHTFLVPPKPVHDAAVWRGQRGYVWDGDGGVVLHQSIVVVVSVAPVVIGACDGVGDVVVRVVCPSVFR